MRLVIAIATVLVLVSRDGSVVAVGSGAGRSGDSPAGTYVVGALRRDGIVIPFAVFDGKRWSTRWPAPQRDLSIPINVESVHSRWWGPPGPRESWQVWTAGEPRTVRVRQTDQVDVHCTSQIGLRTDYIPTEPPPPWTVQPYPKDGLAVSPPQPIERIDIVEPSATELLSLRPALKTAFDRAELETGQGEHPVKRQIRESNDPEIEAAYAYGSSRRVYYIESSRTYRSLRGVYCLIAFGTGWFARTGDTFKRLAMTVDLLACDKYGAQYMYPFGVIKAAAKTYWLAQFSGWDDERFVVIEIKPDGVDAVVNAWGGGC